jgi:gamma-glutamyl hercynylcysteine S-oxide hydrolase
LAAVAQRRRRPVDPRPHPDAESACDSAQLAAHLFELGPERAGEFVRDLGKRDPDAREPYDDGLGWADVPDHHLVDVADGLVTVTELEV